MIEFCSSFGLSRIQRTFSADLKEHFLQTWKKNPAYQKYFFYKFQWKLSVDLNISITSFFRFQRILSFKEKFLSSFSFFFFSFLSVFSNKLFPQIFSANFGNLKFFSAYLVCKYATFSTSVPLIWKLFVSTTRKWVQQVV